MTLFRLSDRPVFPPAEMADDDGLLAVGGHLSPAWLLSAYASGIFPWYHEGQPPLWWSPDPRLVLYPDAFHRPKSLRKSMNKQRFVVTFDCAFSDVMHACGQQRYSTGTWITTDMERAYNRLHTMGYAHSVEAWILEEERPVLAGGLYGIALGRCFFGESMFYRYADASKIAFAILVARLRNQGYLLIDCQMTTAHMLRFGAQEISRKHFLSQLKIGLAPPPHRPQRWR